MFNEVQADLLDNYLGEIWERFKKEEEFIKFKSVQSSDALIDSLEPFRINKQMDLYLRVHEHIKNATGLKMFRDYLTKKYCEENVDYVVAVCASSELVLTRAGRQVRGSDLFA